MPIPWLRIAMSEYFRGQEMCWWCMFTEIGTKRTLCTHRMSSQAKDPSSKRASDVSWGIG